jgi:glutamate/tyrosine decarboxylase-like PLP-dependent enzyme
MARFFNQPLLAFSATPTVMDKSLVSYSFYSGGSFAVILAGLVGRWAMYKESEVNTSESSVEWLKSLGVSGDKVFVGLLVENGIG